MRRWQPAASETLFHHRLFALERRRLEAGAESREALVLAAPDWVNVVPLLDDGRVLLVRQWRYGISQPTLEIPGGMLDDGEDERAAAERELREETGHLARAFERIGMVHPNPAFLANRCATYVASGLERIGEPTGDGDEEIAVEAVAAAELPALIARGEITHAIVIAALYLFELHRRGA